MNLWVVHWMGWSQGGLFPKLQPAMQYDLVKLPMHNTMRVPVHAKVKAWCKLR